jgi:histone H3/H4
MPVTQKGKIQKSSLLGGKGGGDWGKVDIAKSRLARGRPGQGPATRAIGSGRYRRGDIAAMEVEKYQRDGGYLLPRAAFLRLVQEITQEVSSEEHRWEREAVDGLQAISENFLEIMFRSKYTNLFIQVLPLFYIYTNSEWETRREISCNACQPVHPAKEGL